MMGAWFKRDVGRRAFRSSTRHGESLGFRVGSAAGPGRSPPDYNTFRVFVKAHDDTAHGRVGRHLPKTARGEAQRVFHVLCVEIGAHKKEFRPSGGDMATGEMLGKTWSFPRRAAASTVFAPLYRRTPAVTRL